VAERVPVAVVGVGHLGSQHARIYASLPEAELVAVVDRDESRAREIGKKYKVPGLADHRELPQAVRAVSVVVPTSDHSAVAGPLLESGRHVLVEKPMTKTLDEARALVATARERKLVLQVGHIERFNPVVMAALPKVSRPRFIEVRRISPFSFRSSDIGVVLDVMIHDIDLILELVRSDLTEVRAVGVPVLGRSEDIANARLVFASGCVADVTASRVSLKAERKIRIFQEDAYFSLDLLAGKGVHYWKGEKLRSGEFDPSSYKPGMLGDIKAFVFGKLIGQEKLKVKKREPLLSELESFVRAVRDGTESLVPGEHGVRALSVAGRITAEVEASLRSLAEIKAGRDAEAPST